MGKRMQEIDGFVFFKKEKKDGLNEKFIQKRDFKRRKIKNSVENNEEFEFKIIKSNNKNLKKTNQENKNKDTKKASISDVLENKDTKKVLINDVLENKDTKNKQTTKKARIKTPHQIHQILKENSLENNINKIIQLSKKYLEVKFNKKIDLDIKLTLEDLNIKLEIKK